MESVLKVFYLISIIFESILKFFIHFLTIDFELNYDAKSSIDTSWESLFDNVLGECVPTLLPNSYDFWEHLEVTTSTCE